MRIELGKFRKQIDEIEAYRRDKLITLNELCREIGITYMTFARLLAGDDGEKVTLKTYRMIMDFYNHMTKGMRDGE